MKLNNTNRKRIAELLKLCNKALKRNDYALFDVYQNKLKLLIAKIE